MCGLLWKREHIYQAYKSDKNLCHLQYRRWPSKSQFKSPVSRRQQPQQSDSPSDAPQGSSAISNDTEILKKKVESVLQDICKADSILRGNFVKKANHYS